MWDAEEQSDVDEIKHSLNTHHPNTPVLHIRSHTYLIPVKHKAIHDEPNKLYPSLGLVRRQRLESILPPLLNSLADSHLDLLIEMIVRVVKCWQDAV